MLSLVQVSVSLFSRHFFKVCFLEERTCPKLSTQKNTFSAPAENVKFCFVMFCFDKYVLLKNRL